MPITLYSCTNLEILANRFLEDVLAKNNFSSATAAKGSFLSCGNIIVCESKGLQEYLQKTCADKYGIWTALSFKPLVGLLMQWAYNLSKNKRDEKENVYNPHNLVWAIYKLLKGDRKTFSLSSELASLFFAYQIYRPELIEAWDKNEAYKIKNPDENYIRNEKFQRELWVKIKEEYKEEQNIYRLYKSIEHELKSIKAEKKFLPKQIFIFAPAFIIPIHLSTLTYLAEAGCKVNLYLLQISEEYIGEHLSDKKIAALRKSSWAKNETELYWDLGNRLIANLGRTAQTFYEQILKCESEGKIQLSTLNPQPSTKPSTLLSKIQSNIIADNKEKTKCATDSSLVFNNCFSLLREIEVLSDYLLDLFTENKNLTPADIAVVSPCIETYASAIEAVFGRYKIPFRIADRDVKKYDPTVQFLSMLFSLIGSRYEAPDIVVLFEYSMFVQGRDLDSTDIERLEKWVKENAMRYGLSCSGAMPNYSLESGFEQLASGFFMISETEFSEEGDYCYPDIEGSSAKILGDFICFAKALQELEKASKKEKSIYEWGKFFKENLQTFLSEGETDVTEDKAPYQKVIEIWDALQNEIAVAFGEKSEECIDFDMLKNALLGKIETSADASYSMDGKISFSNFETVRAVPHKVICCIGMNSREFPHQTTNKEINLITAEPKEGDKDTANEERLCFLETICSAKEKLYISWIGQSEKNAEEQEAASVVIMLLKNLEEQYEIKDSVVKHPLQPLSKKYFNGTLSTYDNRWANPANSANSGLNIWKWKIASAEEEKKDIDVLYKILSNAPKYFLKNICKIELPEEIELLQNTEPFIVGKGLNEWLLADMILNREDYNEKIKILQFRGELPSGNFANRIIEKKIEQVKEMKNLEEPIAKTFIKPSKDKGKYRLWHWLQHLKYNSETKNSDSYIILLNEKKLPVKIGLKGLSKEQAENAIGKLWDLAGSLKIKMQPIFPNAAWEYLTEKDEWKKIRAAEKIIFGNDSKEGIAKYSQYANMVLKNAKSFKDLGVEKEFVECSMQLFEHYKEIEVKK
jgi:exodeoxyribonuclease V gamma subunit